MRILMVIGQYHPIVGGTEKQAAKLAKALQQQGIEVEVLTIHRRGLSRTEMVDGVRVHRVRGLLYKKIKKYSVMLSIYIYVARNGHKYDVVHIHQGLLPAVAASLAARKMAIPSLVKIGNSGSKFDLELLQRTPLVGHWFCEILIRCANMFIAITPAIEKELQAVGIDECKISNIPNGVEIQNECRPEECRNGLRRAMGCAEDELMGVCVARLTPIKNHETLISAIKKMKTRKVKLFFLGDGPSRQRLDSLILEAGLSDRVKLMGKVDNVTAFLEAADFFVLPSKTEGLSNALLEAMAAGVPPVVSDIPGNRYVVGDSGKNGWLIAYDDVDEWARTMDLISESPQRFKSMGGHARGRVLECFDVNCVARRYIGLYEKMTGVRNQDFIVDDEMISIKTQSVAE